MTNARTIKKRLMRNRATSFWGRRAYWTVRIRQDVLPEPYPFMPDDLGEPWLCHGYWCKRLEDGKCRVTAISHLTSGPGREAPYDEEGPDEDITYGFFESGEYDTSWYEGSWYVTDYDEKEQGPVFGPDVVPIDQGPLDLSLIEKFKASNEWAEPNAFGRATPWADTLAEARFWARATNFVVSPEHLYLTFSVKWYIQSYKRQFCSAAAHFLDDVRQYDPTVKAR